MLIKALLAFLALPGIFGILMPVALGIADPWRSTGYFAGAVVIALGVIVLIWCVRDFYISGKGTLAPWAPPRKLVIIGLYKYTRNPMYIGVLLIVSGITLFAGSPIVLGYFVLLALGFHLRVIWHEEMWLATHFGVEWIKYKESVSRWLPRITKRRNEEAPTRQSSRSLRSG
ncbi:MAG: isoprenylcysteine carboxylmethyltransferase family protein [Deltaproteobacteria bacterium]|nr:isoprenylcysteine carboxylmethyltransferase family protein [Deltaproteobacteria bacterium]